MFTLKFNVCNSDRAAGCAVSWTAGGRNFAAQFFFSSTFGDLLMYNGKQANFITEKPNFGFRQHTERAVFAVPSRANRFSGAVSFARLTDFRVSRQGTIRCWTCRRSTRKRSFILWQLQLKPHQIFRPQLMWIISLLLRLDDSPVYLRHSYYIR